MGQHIHGNSGKEKWFEPKKKLMCGICGIAYNEPSRLVEERQLIAMRDIMVKRGPDDAGSYRAPGIAMGARILHRRGG